ncbi:hypothetical protein GCM10009584_31400 [Ornithinimicrobium humiphilum]|uniref:Uncharacterized protein n=1 Tax=Ornithinimicrobium humiphilum TaxID=125288 RepID=A0A543K5F6_9MICO|nr:hypothetical protein FB476_3248 [Ornithinimicrobium humiphilum]
MRGSIVIRVIPGTPAATAVEAVGGRIIQAVPAAYFPSAHPEVQAWAEDQLVRSSNDVCLEAGDRYSLDDLLDMWMAAYVRMHEDWAPTGDVEATRQAFAGRFAHDLDLHRSSISLIEGRPTAAVFTIGPLDGILMPVLIEIDPRHPGRELAARAAIATMLVRAAPTPVEFDGHADEPTYMRILQDIPQRSNGKLTPMNLVEISEQDARPATGPGSPSPGTGGRCSPGG